MSQNTVNRHGNHPLALLVRLAFLVTLCISLPSGILAQLAPEPRTLNGTVYYVSGGQPAENVTVELHSSEGNLIAPTATNSNGWFEFRGLLRGLYTILIDVKGFNPVNVNVDLTFSSSRGNVFYLQSRSGETGNSANASSVSAHELSMPQKARDLMRSGKKKLYAGKNAEGGLKDFQRAIAIAPGYYEAYYQVAMAELTLGRHQEAGSDLKKAKDLSRDTYGEADIGLGTLLLDQSDFTGGEKDIRRGLELNPQDWLGYYELGRALLNQNRIDEAEQAGLRARSLAPNVPIVYRLLSNMHLRQKNYTALLEDLESYLQLDPDSPAGVRAKELREQVRLKIGTNTGGATTGSTSQPSEKMPP